MNRIEKSKRIKVEVIKLQKLQTTELPTWKKNSKVM
jgi:hypothetical protein